MNGAFEINLFTTGLKTAAMLLIVLAVLICVLHIMKKFIYKKEPDKEQLIKIVSSMYLSPKEKIQVIEISGERIVVGVTPGSINFLARLKDGNKSNE